MLSAFFIDRPKFAFVIAIVTIIAGLLAMRALPIAEYPELTPPQVQVSANYPGANASVVAESVAAVIEAEVNGVEGMTYMSSKSANDGSYTLTVTFSIETDGDTAQVNVQNRVSQAMPKLPEEVKRQGVTTEKTSTSMLMVISIYSPGGTYDSIFLSNYSSMLPLVLATDAGAAARVSVGLTVFGGMLLATILGVTFVPFLYVQLQRLRESVKSKKAEPPPATKPQQT